MHTIDGIDYDDAKVDTRGRRSGWSLDTSDAPEFLVVVVIAAAVLALVVLGLRRLWRVSPPAAVAVAGGLLVGGVALATALW